MAFRFSAVDVRCAWRGGNYLPDGAVDRQAVALMYQGISAGVAAAVVAASIIEGAGSGKYPDDDEIVQWLKSLFPQPSAPAAKSARAGKQAGKRAQHPAERVIADAREWVAQKNPAELTALIHEAADLKNLVTARKDYTDALQAFQQYEQQAAQERARQIVAAHVQRMRDDEEAMNLILELI